MFKNLGKQFRQPSGFLGKLVSKLMVKGNSIAYDRLISKMDIKDSVTLFEIGYGHGLGIDKILKLK